MPIKRAASHDSDSPRDKSTTPSPSKKSRNKGEAQARNPWTKEEDARLLEALDKLAKSHLWNEVKTNEALSKRGADGVRRHWEAMFKKMKKDD